MRIALIIPFVFCLQSDDVIAIQNKRLKIVSIIEVLYFILISVTIFLQLIGNAFFRESLIVNIVIFMSKALMVVAMGPALRRLRKWQKSVSGIFCNEKLMILHWTAFLSATIFDEVSYFLGFIC